MKDTLKHALRNLFFTSITCATLTAQSVDGALTVSNLTITNQLLTFDVTGTIDTVQTGNSLDTLYFGTRDGTDFGLISLSGGTVINTGLGSRMATNATFFRPAPFSPEFNYASVQAIGGDFMTGDSVDFTFRLSNFLPSFIPDAIAQEDIIVSHGFQGNEPLPSQFNIVGRGLAVPEPSSSLLIAIGLTAGLFQRRKK